MLNSRNLFILILISASVALRVADVLPYNFSPIAAIALFGGAMFTNRALGFVLPLLVLFVSDVFIGFHDTMIAVYGSFMLVTLIGQLVRKNPSMLNAVAGSLAGSVIFFLITNAAAWFGNAYYTQDVAGLLNSYALGVPFFRGTVMGDLFFTLVFFGTFQLAKYRFPSLVKA